MTTLVGRLPLPAAYGTLGAEGEPVAQGQGVVSASKLNTARSVVFLSLSVLVLLRMTGQPGSADRPADSMEVRALVLTRGTFEVRVPAPPGAAREVQLAVTITPAAGGLPRRERVRAVLRPVQWATRLEQFPQVEAAEPAPQQAWVGELPIAPTPPGDYLLEARVIERRGKAADAREGPSYHCLVSVHPRPAWLEARAGWQGTEELLQPWPPLRLTRQGQTWQMACWNRTLSLADEAPLFTQITSGGHPLLAAPARILAYNGQGQPLRPAGRWQVEQRSRHRLTLSRDLVGPGGAVRLTLSQEYDGFTWCQIALLGGTLNRLELCLPLRRETTEWLYYWPFRGGYFGDLTNLIHLRYPGEGWSSDFRHYLWLGNTEAGLLWTAESSRFWQRPEEADTIQVLPQGDRTELHLRFLKGDALLRQGTLAFGFQITPVKPWPAEPLHQRVSTFWWASSLLDRYHPPGRLHYDLPLPPDPHRGTLDFFLSPHFDVTIAEEKGSRPLMTLAGPTSRWEVRWLNHSPGLEMFLSTSQGQIEGYGYLYLGGVARKDEWFRITFTWSRERTEVFLNGQPALSLGVSKQSQPLENPGGILLGEPLTSLTFAEGFAADELRLLSEPRPPAQIDATPPSELLPLTLLHDTFDGPAQPLRQIQGGQAVPGARGNGWRVIGHDAPAGTEITLDRLRQAGYRAVTLAENWTTGWGGMEPAHPDELRALVRAAHARGLKVLVYFGFEVSDHLEEVQRFGHELTSDGEVGPHVGRPDYYFPPHDGSRRVYGHATAGPNRERLLAGMEYLLKEYEIDGFYLDGTTLPGGCLNPYIEGATWRDERGELHGTMPLLETRRFAQRMRWLVDHYRPGGVIYSHTSSVLLVPTICFSDVLYNGEQIAYSPDLQKTGWFLADVPLDYYRLLLCGRPWGVPLDDCNTSGGAQRIGLALLHNSGADAYQWDESRWPLRQAWLDRDLWHADFHPYWEVDVRWPDRPPAVHVSFYRGRDGRHTLVITNFSPEPHYLVLPFAAVVGTDPQVAPPRPTVLYPTSAPKWRVNGHHWEGYCPPGTTLVIGSAEPPATAENSR